MPKNILLTSWYTGLGGGETDLLSLAEFLDPHEWTAHLLLPAEGVLSQKWREHGWQVHIIPYRGASTYFIPSIWSKFPVVKQMTSLLRENNIHLIASEYHSLPLIYASARKVNIPIMWTVHGWWFRPKFWQRSFFSSIPVVARSQSIRDGFSGNPPFMPAEKIPVIYSGVDTERFRPDAEAVISERSRLNLSEDTPLVVMVARFQEVKGHHTFQAMARLIASEKPDVHFVIAGEDTFGVSKDESYRQKMLEQAKTDPVLSTNLHYIGFRDDVEKVLASADIVVCASDFESYGKVNLEAMSTATPVVSTNQGGPSETVIDGKTGFLVPPDNPQALAEKVMHLLNNREERQRLGDNGRQHILEKFSATASAKAYTSFFDDIS